MIDNILKPDNFKTVNAMIKYKTPKQIEKELALIERGERQSWGKFYLLLASIDQTRFWQRDADSYSSWILKTSNRLNINAAMLWRIISAGRFVLQTLEKLEGGGIDVPSLEEMPDTVSAENIEILSKLERVMPDNVFLEFARKVFNGKAKRSELRGAWETYRPILEGKTGRGRGVTPPRLNNQNPDQYQSLVEATVLDALRTAEPGWTNVTSPSVFKIYVHVNPEGYFRGTDKYLFAAVAVVKPQNGPVEYHGIRFRTTTPISPNFYRTIMTYCDYLWILNHTVSEETLVKGYTPEKAGILEVKDNIVSVVRPSVFYEGSGSNRHKLASALLVRALGTK